MPAAGGAGIDVRIIGFAEVMGDIADGASSVLLFAVITIVLTLLAVRCYCQSWSVALRAGACARWSPSSGSSARSCCCATASIRIGLLVPFLIFAIGVSHGVQKISAVGDAAFAGMGSMDAARRTFRQLLVPAIVALLADLVGFVTILLIPVPVIREMAVTASIGVAIVILTDLVLLPVLVSFVHFDAGYHARVERRQPPARRACGCGSPASRARGPALRHHRRRRAARRARPVEGARNADRRHPGRGAGAAGATRATTATTTSSPRKFNIGVDVLTAIVRVARSRSASVTSS